MSTCVSYMYKIYNSGNIHLKETSTPINKIIYFLKPGRAQQRTEMYSSKVYLLIQNVKTIFYFYVR